MPPETDLKPAEALRQRAKEERQLLRAEQEAERKLLDATERLATAQTRLEKAQSRVERRRGRVAKALDELRLRQEARAAGPDGAISAAASAEPIPQPAPASAPARDEPPVPEAVSATVSEPTDGARPATRSTKRRDGTPVVPA